MQWYLVISVLINGWYMFKSNHFVLGAMALVLDPKDNTTVLGILTLEDLLEELLEIDLYYKRQQVPLLQSD